MIDMNDTTRTSTPAVAADAIRQYILTGAAGSAPRNGAWRLSDGCYVLSSFKAEGPKPNKCHNPGTMDARHDERLVDYLGYACRLHACYLK